MVTQMLCEVIPAISLECAKRAIVAIKIFDVVLAIVSVEGRLRLKVSVADKTVGRLHAAHLGDL